MDNKKGKLTIFVSYTPGAGKSYLMVSRAMEQRACGRKVILGFLNDSHRNINNMAEDNNFYLEIKEKHLRSDQDALRPHKMKYSLKELLGEKPDLVIMDEMGMHGINRDGSTFVYEDIEKLLDAGIDVYTTANLKRFEGANPIFKQATGIGIKKTVPDKFLEEADSIIFIDREPELMIQDFGKGKLFNDKYMNSKIMKKNFQEKTLKEYRNISKRYLKKYEDKVEIVTR
ncbi:MAG: hypothetical protein ACLRZ9_07665 [Eubacterium sp.]